MKKYSSYLIPIIFCILLSFLLGVYYFPKSMIAGGEGSYFFDFNIFFRNFSQSWINRGTGTYLFSLNFGYVFHLIFLQKIFNNERLLNFIVISSQYLLPFIAFYLLGKQIGLKSKIAFIGGIFYLINPFMITFLKSINQWNMLIAYMLPVNFLIILRYFHKDFKLFFIFGLNSLFFSFTNANPPTMVICQISILLSVIYSSFYYYKSPSLMLIAKKYLLVFFSFLIFNLWWILNWFYIYIDAAKGYSSQFAISWLKGDGRFIPALWKTLTQTNLLGFPIDRKYDFLANHYGSFWSILILPIPLFLIIYSLYKTKEKKLIYIIIISFLLISFLAKGVQNLFGDIYEFFIMNIPIFNIFKSAGEKWGILSVFILSLFILFYYKYNKNSISHTFFSSLLGIYIMFLTIPLITGNIIPDYNYNKDIKVTRKFIDKKEYLQIRDYFNGDPLIYRILNLPGSLNYQIALKMDNGKYYTGNDPILNNINKASISSYSETFLDRFGVIFDSLSEKNFPHLLALFNIKKILVNRDIYPWFGFSEKEDITEVESIFEKLLEKKDKIFSLFDIGDKYLPRIYVPQKIVFSPTNTIDDLMNIINTQNNNKTITAVFLGTEKEKNQNNNYEKNPLLKMPHETVAVAQIQSFIYEEKLKKGTKEFNPGGVHFPYARWKPGSLIYPMVEKKELKAKSLVSDNSYLSFKQHLFYSSKRIFEIQKWGRELSEKEYSNIMFKYQKEMEDAIIDMDKYFEKNTDIYPLMLEIEVTYNAQFIRLNNILEGNYKNKENNNNVILTKKIFEIIDEKLNLSLKKHYYPTKYKINIPENGEYELLAKKNETDPLWKVINLSNEDKKKFLIASEIQNNSDWLSYGNINFLKGEKIFQFEKTKPQNLISDKWEKLKNNLIFDSKTIVKTNYFPPPIVNEINNWEKNSIYRLSLKCFLDVPLELIVVEENDAEKINSLLYPINKTKIIGQNSIKPKKYWQEINISFETSRFSQNGKIIFYPLKSFPKISQINCKDYYLETIIDPMLIAVKRNSTINEIPNIKFSQINSAKYEIKIDKASKPFILIFSESYHRGWKAYIKSNSTSFENIKRNIIGKYFGGKIQEIKHSYVFFDKEIFNNIKIKEIPEENHFTMNGYANAWYISPKDSNGKTSYYITLEYEPQRIFYIGILLSAVSILTIIFIKLIKK